MSGGSSWPESPRAEELFAQWLDVREGPGAGEGAAPVSFERFREGHPDEREALDALHGIWARFESIASELGAAAPADEAPPPEHPRYRVERRLAAGGMGVVYEVLDAQLGRRLAMKVLKAARDGELAKRRRARFVDEARVVGQLEHPGIVPIHELGHDAAGQAWFTMRLVEGRTLAEILAAHERGDPEWSLARVLRVLRRVCDTMAYAHSRDVIHRDLKPANIMVGPFGETYVMDWGLARSGVGEAPGVGGGAVDGAAAAPEVIGQTLDGDVLGTPAYMSPEQARGALGDVGRATDVYAIGAMLHHLVAGGAPYAEHGTAAEMLAALRAGPPRAPASSAPAELLAITARAMERDPARRYRDLDALSADLDAFLEGRVVQAFEAGAWPELKKWIARNRTLSLLAAAALTLGLISVAAVLRTSAVRTAEQAVTQRFRDMELLEDRRTDSRLAWPAWPARVPEIERNIVAVEELGRRLPEHRAAAATTDDPWTAAKYRTLVEELEEFVDEVPGRGDLADLRLRRERARAILELAESPAVDTAWAAIADERPKVPRADDLFPLGRLPGLGSGPLAEPGSFAEYGPLVFEHLPSASLERLAELADGAPQSAPTHPVAGHGLQLLALPLGARPADFAQPDAGGDGSGAAPEGWLLCSRYELNRAQWSRAGGPPVSEHTALLPVVQVSWSEAIEGAWRLGLTLPSVDELERAALGGAAHVYWWGDDLADAVDREVLHFDTSAEPTLHAVGRGAANPFGLFDAFGSVAEWTRDAFSGSGPTSPEFDAFSAGPLELEAAAARRPARASVGAHYLFGVEDLRAAFGVGLPLYRADASERSPWRGLRPVRAVSPEH